MENSSRRSSSSAPKVERKVIEKNRRNLMKDLYSQLQSLLPNHASNNKEQIPLADTIEEAVNYIKSLQINLEKSKEKKEYLLRRKRPYSCIETEISETKTLPLIQIHEMDPLMDVILAKGLDNTDIFNDIVSFLHNEGVEIVNASFSIHGNSMFHIAYENVEKSKFGFGATTLSTRLKELVSAGASTSDDMESLDLWDFEIEPCLWSSQLAEAFS